MKKVLKNVSFVILFLKMCFIFGQEIIIQKKIIIDVGHGGKDSGAIGVNGIQEKDVVLNIALEILRLSEESEKPLDIYLTRYSDTLISLSDRSGLAKKINADLFLSLPCNASTNNFQRDGSLSLKYFLRDVEPNIRKSVTLGIEILKESTKNLNFEARGIKYANFQVLREAIQYCSSILIEVDFLSNKNEESYFSNPKKIKAIALDILIGVENYLKIKL